MSSLFFWFVYFTLAKMDPKFDINGKKTLFEAFFIVLFILSFLPNLDKLKKLIIDQSGAPWHSGQRIGFRRRMSAVRILAGDEKFFNFSDKIP